MTRSPIPVVEFAVGQTLHDRTTSYEILEISDPLPEASGRLPVRLKLRRASDGEERWVHSTSAETMIASGGLLLVHTCSSTEEAGT